MRIKIRWDFVSTLIVGMAGAFLAGVLVSTAAVANATDDPWNGVPACTNEIADAGGICHGEPAAFRNGTVGVGE